ncbi:MULTISPECIES: ATP-dependent DNA helicase RecG [Campylobacter]|uniref:ATP-dependent DNA helicase RecG n=1 Tax=Campylobacter TaxID=194 RepID=UPI000A348C83|nr:ATP-dependent DNA helicase RecG [Campylobacter sp. P0124]MCR8697067.1 ATP-dependent DNA helicase RecG [Campylobacter sp. RM19073]
MEQIKELKELGIASLLDLALILPKSFEDLRIKNQPNSGDNSVEIEIKSTLTRPNTLNVLAYCISWDCSVSIVIFNAKAWHYASFKRGKRLYIYGKSVPYNGIWQFSNPKIITKVGQIIPHYKRSIKDSQIQKLIQKYISLDSLIAQGLEAKEANEILSLHNLNETNSALNLTPKQMEILKFIEIFNYLKKLSVKKVLFKATAINPYDISQWLDNLPFKPTNDQLKALNDIKIDLAKDLAAKRVIMGDVGSGKTLVILGAALLNYPNLSILMAPTTILATQLYSEAIRLLPKFMKVVYLQKGSKNINLEDANLIVGTHVLLYQNLPKSTLIMIDEQHRFGSTQRQKIDELTRDESLRAHFLQFSATPIPRTLCLIESELVSFSFLKQTPFIKQIKTLIIQNSGFNALLEHIKAQIQENKQTIIIYPLIEDSQVSNYQSLSTAAPFWLNKFQKVYITHGKDKQKDDILEQFANDGNILLATTIVEVGISLPRLSTIVIVGAEKLGLASLHQLRGRVSRNGGVGWCYLYTKLDNIPSRLKEFAKTLDGFEVAKIDLKNRQAGDILDGTIQHGATFEYYDMEEDIAQKAKSRLAALRGK